MLTVKKKVHYAAHISFPSRQREHPPAGLVPGDVECSFIVAPVIPLGALRLKTDVPDSVSVCLQIHASA